MLGGMNARTRLLVKAAGTAFFAFATAAAFSAYLRPAMLVEFANLVLCY
jgi:hypothetical protein